MTTDTAEATVLELTPIAQPVQAGALATQQRGAVALPETAPMSMMLTALERGATPETIEKMMGLQERWEANEARKAFNQALADFKGEPLTVRKNKQVGYTTREGDFVGYKHAELSEVVETVSPLLAKHGFSFRWDVTQTAQWITVTCILRHAKGHSEQIAMGGPPDNSGKKNAIQQIASTTSYLQRYTLKAITGVAEAGDDDDGQGGADDGAGAPPPPPPAPRAPAGAPAQRTYPADRFDKNLPEWRELIATGAKTPEQIIKMVNSKGSPLSDDQVAAIREPATAPAATSDMPKAAPRMTFAQVADKLAKAKSVDDLDAAASLISAVLNKQHRAELTATYDARRASFNPA